MKSKTKAAASTGFVLALVNFTCAAFATSTSSPLAAYHNENRVLVVYAPKATDTRYLQEQSLLRQGTPSGFTERQLILIRSFASGRNDNQKQSAALRAFYRVDSTAFRISLIGKDGNVAFSSSVPVSPSDIFAKIDSMPMRRDEMRRSHER